MTTATRFSYPTHSFLPVSGTLNWLMEVVPWNAIGTMVPTCEPRVRLPLYASLLNLTTFCLQSDHYGATHVDWNPMWDIVGRGSYPHWHSPGLCVALQTFEPVPAGPECRTKRDYEAFIEGCLRRDSARPCLCSCNV